MSQVLRNMNWRRWFTYSSVYRQVGCESISLHCFRIYC